MEKNNGGESNILSNESTFVQPAGEPGCDNQSCITPK